MNERSVPDAVRWHDGLLLAPQHFQQAFSRQDALLGHHLSIAQPWWWGVLEWSHQANRLIDGVFQIETLSAVMPDGLAVEQAEDDSPLLLDLNPHRAAMADAPVTVWLAVPKQFVGTPPKGVPSRTVPVETGPVPDIHTGEGGVVVPRVRASVRLLVESDVSPAYTAFPLACVTVRDNVVSLTGFSPPMLRVAVSSALGQGCLDLARAMRQKAATLVDRVTSPTAASNDPAVQEARVLISLLTSALPQFEGLAMTGMAHPFTLYMGLLGLVGRVAALAPDMTPPTYLAYNHNDPAGSFAGPFDFVRRMIGGIHDVCRPVSFTRVDGRFELTLRAEWLRADGLVLGVRRGIGASDADAASWVREAIVASSSCIDMMSARRTRGADRVAIDRDDTFNLLPGRGQTLFRVTPGDDAVLANEPLVIVNRADPLGHRAPAEIVLYVVSGLPPAPLSEAPA